MYDRDVVGHVGMGVGFGRLAVSRPAGVADPCLTKQWCRFQPSFEIAQLAFGAPAPERAVLHGGDARGVVAAVFQPLQRIDELASDRSFAEDANNAAHLANSDSRLTRIPIYEAKTAATHLL